MMTAELLKVLSVLGKWYVVNWRFYVSSKEKRALYQTDLVSKVRLIDPRTVFHSFFELM